MDRNYQTSWMLYTINKAQQYISVKINLCSFHHWFQKNWYFTTTITGMDRSINQMTVQSLYKFTSKLHVQGRNSHMWIDDLIEKCRMESDVQYKSSLNFSFTPQITSTPCGNGEKNSMKEISVNSLNY